MDMQRDVDVAIVGAGPAGLCLARSLAGAGLSIALLERQALPALREAAFDGREIALTHTSRRILEELDIWPRIDAADISLLRDARVLNGSSSFALDITAQDGRSEQLGWLVPNFLIRRAAFEAVAACDDVALHAEVEVRGLRHLDDAVELQLSDGKTLRAVLLVAADSRFSGTRKMLGIGAQMRDFGREMMVCRVEHELPHQHVAMEWFRYGQTLALLPLNGDRASVVLTLPGHEMQALQALDDAALGQEFERRFDGRMGKMQVIGSRHVYPLVGVYAEKFVGRRCALVGDAAVGMHPVTAHGFNLGLLGQQRLAREVLAAHRAGRGPACPAALRRYERGHRMTARPLYLATTLVAGMYGDERPPARLARDAALRLAQHVTPFRRLIAAHLTRG